MAAPTARLLPADQFTIEELTEAYNQTRVDYLVPMPMNPARLAEYVHTYDIDLHRSIVAMNGSAMLGLGMLGVRPDRSWVTRLGVLPNRRRKGIGEEISRAMLAESDKIGISINIIEVIQGNTPAHSLFSKLGFEETRELVILRRAPQAPKASPTTEVQWMEREHALECLRERHGRQAWTNEDESLHNAENLYGLQVDMNGSGRGWMVFQKSIFNLSRLMYHTQDGNPVEIMGEMITHLHSKFPNLDTYTENIPAEDEHLPAFFEAGYIDVFRRVEMVRQN